jgi:hypothetical protein
MKLPQFNMFVHSACCMKHWYLANLPTGGQALICIQCSKAAEVKAQILKFTEVVHLGAGSYRTASTVRKSPARSSLVAAMCRSSWCISGRGATN